jgi:hypothetical protein
VGDASPSYVISILLPWHFATVAKKKKAPRTKNILEMMEISQ